METPPSSRPPGQARGEAIYRVLRQCDFEHLARIYHGVERCDELAQDGDQGEFVRLPVSPQTLGEGFEHGIWFAGGVPGHGEYVAQSPWVAGYSGRLGLP